LRRDLVSAFRRGFDLIGVPILINVCFMSPSDINAVTNAGQSVLGLATEHHEANHPIVTLLQQLGAATDAHVHVVAQDYTRLKESLEKEPWLVNAQDANGWTPLHEAVVRQEESIVSLLVEMGADVNAVTHAGESAVDLADHSEQESMVQLLERLGAGRGDEL
jgi:ankyrin repeat protein